MLTSNSATLSPIEAHILAESHKSAGRLPEEVTDIMEWLEDFSVQYPEYGAYSAKIATVTLALDFEALRMLVLASEATSTTSST